MESFLIKKFPLTLIGVLASGSAHARPSAWLPIDMSEKFPPHMSTESSSNTFPNPPAKSQSEP